MRKQILNWSPKIFQNFFTPEINRCSLNSTSFLNRYSTVNLKQQADFKLRCNNVFEKVALNMLSLFDKVKRDNFWGTFLKASGGTTKFSVHFFSSEQSLLRSYSIFQFDMLQDSDDTINHHILNKLRFEFKMPNFLWSNKIYLFMIFLE